MLRLLGQKFGGVILPLAILGVAIVIVVYHRELNRPTQSAGITGIRYDIRTSGGAPLASIFDGVAANKLEAAIVEHLIALARNPKKPGKCPAGGQSSWVSDSLSLPKVYAQGCMSDCTGHYLDSHTYGNPTCPNAEVCFGSENWDIGCEGTEWPCDNGGYVCGQSWCTNH